MPPNPYPQLKRDIEAAIADKQKRDSLYYCMKRGRDTRAEALAAIPGGAAFRADVKRTKDACRDRQEELLDQFIENARKRGTIVYVAKDREEAVALTLRIAREKAAKTVSKSKSLTTEELELNEPMEEACLQVVETDLGELIIQLVDEKPYHLVFPSVHKTAGDVAEIFSKATGESVPNDIDAIMVAVRKYLRPIFLNTDIGMTGANIGIAETGGIVIETNEGNGRLVSSIGKCHICVMGIEKIVESVEDALLMVMAHPVSASGQCPTTYVTWMHGRSPLGEGNETPRESHMIVLDNGRREMRADTALREALSCIRCGACMNICPTYGVVGGHTFGHIYPGPIGIPWTAQTHGLDKAAAIAPLCISCGLCKEICPADIDMPLMIAEIKQRVAKEVPVPHVDRAMMAADRFAALGSATAPFSNWFLANSLFRVLLEKTVGLDRRRDLPPFARRSLKRMQKAQPLATEKTHKVAFFCDTYFNYNNPELGLRAIEHLRSADCEVVLPEQQASGYPYIAYGDLRRAREVARFNVEHLASFARKGYRIVAPEPTAAYALQISYPKLLPESEDARLVAECSAELFEFLLEIGDAPPPQSLAGRTFGFHCSCHQRPLASGEATLAWLRKGDALVERVETGTCCGMGGTFGLKTGPLGYDLSCAVGEPLFDAFKTSEVEAIVTESSVCGIQLREGTGLPVYHPIDLLGPTRL